MQTAVTTLATVNKKMSRLVLTRKVDEQVVIHDDNGVIARVKISKVDRNQVRLTFEADNEIRIDRQEVYERNAPTK
jgi:carbon storage regulator CsrA